MTTLLIILGVVVALIWVFNKLKPMVAGAGQISFLNAYLRYSQTPACSWIMECSDKDDLIAKGQDRLWDAAKGFHDNMNKLSKNEFKVQPDNTEMIEQVFEIISTVHLMHAAENGDIQFSKAQPEVEPAEDKA